MQSNVNYKSVLVYCCKILLEKAQSIITMQTGHRNMCRWWKTNF